ncbi:rhodanese-like domain-containing protein [Sphaerotilus sp.]|uniref:rhodanese-like domain-containing protein n=1 Tax=Sphaerotilus sp. TaxID=2093942 RepID=UPI002ACEB1CF|nr:rhodanese-like domain-containing protein [Sphaerotilus sp.]MDZ7855030.1 rhodanese-like domain-containing protein [Sphaerotilus sp.]
MKTAHDLVTAARARITECPLAEAEPALLNAELVLDVREPDEYAAGHLPGAVNIPRGLLEFKVSATPALERRDLKIVVYCKTGGRAALAACSLQEMGYVSVQSVAGGFDAWVAQGGLVARPEPLKFD